MPPTIAHVKCTNCGQPHPASDERTRCARCLDTRRPSDRARRQAIAAALFPPKARRRLLARVSAGVPFPDACRDLGITQARARGYSAYDAQWGHDLDAALTAGRDPDLAHGTINAYRWGRCRCPECRQARAALG